MNRLLTLRYLCGIYESVTYPMSHIPEISPVDLTCVIGFPDLSTGFPDRPAPCIGASPPPAVTTPLPSPLFKGTSLLQAVRNKALSSNGACA
jgi:hypothetical protein